MFLTKLIFLFFILNCLKANDLSSKINHYISEIITRYNIPGSSIAIIKNKEVIYRNHFGKASIEFNVPISEKSVYRIYSLTKPIVATGLFQLIEQKKVSLDNQISVYLDDLPSEWKMIRIKNLLRHSSGLPDIKKYDKLTEDAAKRKVYLDPIKFEQGTQFEYNQTNYWLLQRIIEKVTLVSLDSFILKKQFRKNILNKNVFFSTDSRDIYPNRVTNYFPFSSGRMQIELPFRGEYLKSANGLNIRLAEFIEWDRLFSENHLISDKTKRKMWESKRFSNQNRKWAFGWNQHIIDNHISYGFSGSMITAYRIFPKEKLSIIFLSNGFEVAYDVEDVINNIANMVLASSI